MRGVVALSGLAAAILASSLAAVPAGATLVCPPGATNPSYCRNVFPIGTTSTATGIGKTSATLNGVAGPGVSKGDITNYTFQYGKTKKYGTSTPLGTVGSCPPGVTNPNYCSVPSTQFVSAKVVNLSSNTTYHYRIVASNSDGTTFGLDQTFTTGKKTVKPIVFVHAPKRVKHNHHFTVTIRLRVRSTVTIKFAGKTTTVTRSHNVRQRLKAPHKKGHYKIKVTATGGGRTQTVTKKIKVF